MYRQLQFIHRFWSALTHKLHRQEPLPDHLQSGQIGERAARRYLKQQGYKFITANYTSPTRRGEIDLIFRDGNCLVFVEVKTRDVSSWYRPAAAVDHKKQRRLSLTALDYLRQLRTREVRFRFDIVEVLLEDEQLYDLHHIPNAFPLAHRDYYP